VLGGECNYLLGCAAVPGEDGRLRYELQSREQQWLQCGVWKPDDGAVQAMLDVAEASLQKTMREMQLRNKIIRKPRAIGIVPGGKTGKLEFAEGHGSTTMNREALDEVVLRLHADLNQHAKSARGPATPLDPHAPLRAARCVLLPCARVPASSPPSPAHPGRRCPSAPSTAAATCGWTWATSASASTGCASCWRCRRSRCCMWATSSSTRATTTPRATAAPACGSSTRRRRGRRARRRPRTLAPSWALVALLARPWRLHRGCSLSGQVLKHILKDALGLPRSELKEQALHQKPGESDPESADTDEEQPPAAAPVAAA